MTGDRSAALLHEVRGGPGKQKVELPPLPAGPVLLEGRLAEDESCTVKGEGLFCGFGQVSPEKGVAERALWCTDGEPKTVKVKAKTEWTLRFHGPEAATPLTDSVTGVGTDVLVYNGPAADAAVVSHEHPDAFLEKLIADGLNNAQVDLFLPPDATHKKQWDVLSVRSAGKRDALFTLPERCLFQLSAGPWCEWTVTLVGRR
ncbi:hypothetical protein ACQEU8_16995 [Streptomyces sp. CA-250714]|uniref:hypothetical protein n=1 Tax=Streptomyces sp. CA-250714 TaxID=3240060 RepID=UPI003D8EB821